MLDRLGEGDVSEDLGPALVGVVRDPLAVLDAVAGVVEAARGREPAGVERRCGGDDLEGRTGDEEALRRAVEQRARASAGGLRPQDLVEIGLRRDSGRRRAGRRARARDPSMAREPRRRRTCPPRASIATLCARASIVVTTSFPFCVRPLSLSSALSKSGVEVRVRARSGSRSATSRDPCAIARSWSSRQGGRRACAAGRRAGTTCCPRLFCFTLRFRAKIGLAVGGEDPPALDSQLLDEEIGIPAPSFEVRGASRATTSTCR